MTSGMATLIIELIKIIAASILLHDATKERFNKIVKDVESMVKNNAEPTPQQLDALVKEAQDITKEVGRPGKGN